MPLPKKSRAMDSEKARKQEGLVILRVKSGAMETVKVKKHEGLDAKLPLEIWGEIGKRLHSRLDFTRFRSVCTTWRSSLPPPTRFPLRVPPPPGASETKFHNLPFFIKEHTFYCFDAESEADQPNRMLMVLEEVDQGGKFHPRRFLPLIKDCQTTKTPHLPPIPQISRLSFVSKVYDLMMALPLFLHGNERVEGKWKFRYFCGARKAVLIFANPSSVDANYAAGCDLTAVALLDGGKLALLRLGNPLLFHWETDFCSSNYKDIISYNGKLFAVDSFGRVFVMNYHSLQMTQIALLPSSNQKIQFVVTLGHLYLFILSDPPDLKVYKLRPEIQQLVEVEDLGDQVFFMYTKHSFSVPRTVFADTGLMDLRYKMPPTFGVHTLIFSYRTDDQDKDELACVGTGTGFFAVPIVSRPCICPWDVKAAAKANPTTATSSVLSQFENTSVARTNYHL